MMVVDFQIGGIVELVLIRGLDLALAASIRSALASRMARIASAFGVGVPAINRRPVRCGRQGVRNCEPWA